VSGCPIKASTDEMAKLSVNYQNKLPTSLLNIECARKPKSVHHIHVEYKADEKKERSVFRLHAS
jgi:hypothetical protein